MSQSKKVSDHTITSDWLPTEGLLKGVHESSDKPNASFEEVMQNRLQSVFETRWEDRSVDYTPIFYRDLPTHFSGLYYSDWEQYYQSVEGKSTIYKYMHFFNAVYDMSCTYVYRPLAESALKNHSRFNSFAVDPRVENTRLRVELLVRTAFIFNFLFSKDKYKELDGFLHLWFYLIKPEREKLIEKYKEDLSKAPNVAKERTFTGFILPLNYSFAKKNTLYCRLFSVNNISWQNMDKRLEKKPIAAKLEEITGIKIYNVGMGACHPRLMAKYTTEPVSPELYKAMSFTD